MAAGHRGGIEQARPKRCHGLPTSPLAQALLEQPGAAQVAHEQCRSIGALLVGESGGSSIDSEDGRCGAAPGKGPGAAGDDCDALSGVGDRGKCACRVVRCAAIDGYRRGGPEPLGDSRQCDSGCGAGVRNRGKHAQRYAVALDQVVRPVAGLLIEQPGRRGDRALGPERAGEPGGPQIRGEEHCRPAVEQPGPRIADELKAGVDCHFGDAGARVCLGRAHVFVRDGDDGGVARSVMPDGADERAACVDQAVVDSP